jgi:AcrR family transcriptional regulator
MPSLMPLKRVPRHRTARAAQRLACLQDTAAELFLDCGYQGVTVDMLIRRVGGSRRNVYGHFGGKPGLFAAAMQSSCDQLACPLESLQLSDQPDQPALVEFGTALLGLVLQPRALAMHRMMVAESRHFPQLAQTMWHAGPGAAVAKLSTWIAQRQQAGSLRIDVPAEWLAEQFVNLLIGSPQRRALTAPLRRSVRSKDIALHVERCVGLLLAGAGHPDNAPASRRNRTTVTG